MALQLSHPLRSYLKLPRTRAILGCFLAISLLFVAFPGIDLGVSRLFYDGGFFMANQAWTRLLHASVTWFVAGSLGAAGAAWLFNRLAARNLGGIDGRRVAYLFLVLLFGAGFIVNGMLKDGFGRARPRDVVEFGGAQTFTPAYAISSACDRNCSFSSGDSAGAFFSLAVAAALGRRRRAAVAAAAGYGILVSAARIASGAHYLSDTIASFFVMLAVADALYYRMFVFERVPAAPTPVPVPVAVPVLASAVEKPAVRL